MPEQQPGPAGPGPQDLEELIARMAPPADALTWFVHTYQPAAVHRLLAGLNVLELRALAVVLAKLRRPRWSLPEDGIVDELAVEIAARGEQVALTKTERRRAAERIVAAGHSAAELGTRLHLSGSTALALYEEIQAAQQAGAKEADPAAAPQDRDPIAAPTCHGRSSGRAA
ncbi:hypothetical protein [Nonomuraea typhae]|uniref:hypothetical protein n=1 Tax=Nonomuraea typhae TaxID=2603600 RepID=UPI0012FAED1E|nr:hypothetical protein [Nonomuraea typhae]